MPLTECRDVVGEKGSRILVQSSKYGICIDVFVKEFPILRDDGVCDLAERRLRCAVALPAVARVRAADEREGEKYDRGKAQISSHTKALLFIVPFVSASARAARPHPQRRRSACAGRHPQSHRCIFSP